MEREEEVGLFVLGLSTHPRAAAAGISSPKIDGERADTEQLPAGRWIFSENPPAFLSKWAAVLRSSGHTGTFTENPLELSEALQRSTVAVLKPEFK